MATVLGVTLGVYITHPTRRDIEIVLQSPDGTLATLILSDGSTGDDLGSGTADADLCIFDDTAALAILDLAAGDPSTGRFRPDPDPLSAFIGVEPAGTWTVTVTDTSPGDTGTVQKLSLWVETEGGTIRVDETTPTALPDATPLTFENFPVAFPLVITSEMVPAVVGGLIPRALEPGYFRITITSLHHGPVVSPPQDARPAKTLARLEDFSDASVTIPINDQRQATVTISMDDPACRVVEPYKTLLHIIYATPTQAHLVFWGIITQPVWDSTQGTLTIPAVDMSLKLQWRQVRFGTRILNSSTDADEPNPFNTTASKRSTGFVPLDYVGLSWIRDAARNNGPQDDRGVPPLGITDGLNTASALPHDTPYKIEARRGDTLWDLWQQVAGYQIAPDFELEPRDGALGVYARLNTFTRQGHTDPGRIIFHDGFGLDNCNLTYQPGGKLYTATHVLSTGDQARVTVSDDDAEDEYGLYVKWDGTDYPATALDTLQNLGQQTIDAYSTPPDYFLIAPSLDCGLYYLDDFAVGDAMTAAVRRGQLKREVTGDIRSVKLNQADQSGNVQIGLDVAVSVSRTTTISEDA